MMAGRVWLNKAVQPLEARKQNEREGAKWKPVLETQPTTEIVKKKKQN
jgi:hypothetical protein